MVKVIGSVCIVLGCSLIGIIANRRLIERVLVLQDLVSALKTVESEIGSQLSPIPAALKNALNTIGNENSACALFINQVLIGMEVRGAHEFPEIWRSSAESMDVLRVREKSLLNELADKLGRYDAEEQLSAMRLVRSGLERFMHAAEEERSKSGKVYLTLGTALGIAIVIILL